MKFPVDLGLVLSSIAASELARLRRRSILDDDLWSIGPDTRFGDAALPLDSIELLSLAAAVSEMFHLAESGAGDYLLRYRSIAEWREIVAQAWLSERITFRTSGSTGEPKKCAHRTSDLRAELQLHAARFTPPESGMPARVVSCVPAHHIYGFLFTAMLPCTLGIPVVRSRGIPQLAPRDLVIATPYVWRHIDRAIDHFPDHTFGVTSGAPCPDDLFSSLTRKGLDLTEIYGSSETAGVGSRTVAGAPFELLANRPALPEVPDEIEMVATRRFRVLGRKTARFRWRA